MFASLRTLAVTLATTSLLGAATVASATDPTAEQLLEQTGIRAGLCVRVGTTDGKLEAGLATGGGLLVHGLSLDNAAVDNARVELQDRGVYGLASVDLTSSLERLPYADNLANLVVADLDALGAKGPQLDEIKRVLAPLGAACIKRNGKWTKITERLPAQMDEWPQWDRGADGNPSSRDELVAPTTSLRWLAGSTNTHGAGSKVGLRLSGGRMFYTSLGYDPDHNWTRNEPKNDVIARDAFNGVLHWKRPLDGLPADGDQPPRFALAAVDGRVYCYLEEDGPLCALDATTGETIVRFEDGPPLPPITGWNKHRDPVSRVHFVVRIFDGKVLQTYQDGVYLSDARTGKLLWKQNQGKDGNIGWAVVGGGQIFLAVSRGELINNRASQATPLGEIVALDARTGNVRWRYDGLSGRVLFRMIYYRDSVIVPTFVMSDKHSRSKRVVTRLSASDGSVVWQSDGQGEGRGHYTMVMARDDEIIVGQQSGFGVDFNTGKMTQKYGWGQPDNSCADLKCVPNYTFYGMTFIDRDGNRITRGQTRSICDVGQFPAYGLLYGSPLGCLCSEYVNGYLALSADPLADPVADEQRLIRGPAYDAVARLRVSRSTGDVSDEWPMFMADPRRGCSTTNNLPDELAVKWKRHIAAWPAGTVARDWQDSERIVGLVTAPTVAAGKVFVAAPDAHRVDALDATTGEPAWSFTAGARIDSPPTILGAGDDAICVFGCRDGRVYCLRAADGQLAWRFLTAPLEQRICVQSQLESPWPVFGSVMVHQGGIVVAAGRQSAVDGGVFIYKLAPHDGSIVWKTRLWTDPDAAGKLEDSDLISPKTRNRRVNDLLVSNGRNVCLWITPLANEYAAGELVDIETRVIDARAMKFSISNKDELQPLDDATWLWSASSGGLMSRRYGSVGRHDGSGVNYADLNAVKICRSGDTLYAMSAASGKAKDLRGGLVRIALSADGRLPEKTVWKASGPRWGTNDAMIVAGERIYISHINLREPVPHIQVYAADDGAKIADLPLEARVIKDGMAAAYGRLYVSCTDGSVVCLGE